MTENDQTPKYPGKRVTMNGNQLMAMTEALIADGGVFYPITPSTEGGEMFELLYAKGQLNAFGRSFIAIEAEGEHAAQGGAIALSVTGKRVVNFTSGQGVVYGIEQYYHAPGKMSTMVLEVAARALTKHALNVHCGHDDVYATLDTGWTTLFAKEAQQGTDQAIILRRVNELSLNPGINVQDGFIVSHLEKTFLKPEAELIREFLGRPEDIIDCPTEAQRTLFGPTRRRVPKGIDLNNPLLLGPVQNQEHYMNGIGARRNNFAEPILEMLEKAYEAYGKLTGRHYGLISQYHCEGADTVFVALGSAAENMEAASDYVQETRGQRFGVLHVNCLRPFPENALIQALKGKKNVIVMERTDEALSGDNPLARDIKSALNKAAENFSSNAHAGLDKLDPATEMPRIVAGSYGLGSRDFRPEGVIGAYDFTEGRLARKDGQKVTDGVSFFYVGIDHPYAVKSDETPSCLPENSIAVRLHSIGGWGMITTGKNLGEILGEFSQYISKRDHLFDAHGVPIEVVNISANPKYGSEKKGAPTNYFLVAAPDRVRVNCDLEHVNVVLCCDPKIFLHTNPLHGMQDGGAFVWESNETSPEKAWQRIPRRFRQFIIDKKIRIFTLHGFDIAKRATHREDLQTRMQGNAFLGAFFGVSPFLKDYKIPDEEFLDTVREQYVKKFGRFGDAVVESNMTVMREGFNSVIEVQHGAIDAPDRSAFISATIKPFKLQPDAATALGCTKAPLFTATAFNNEFKAGLGYHQPSTPLAAVGVMAAGSGASASKYVARREIPVYIEENCTQCMDCITVCPDTALPNTAQDIGTIISTAAMNYVSDRKARKVILDQLPEIEAAVRAEMLAQVGDKTIEKKTRFKDIIINEIGRLNGKVGKKTLKEIDAILDVLPMSYVKTKTIFSAMEKKEPGAGGVFSIFVKDLCKGCAACVDACGSHEALKMVEETEELHAQNETANDFLNLLQDTPQKYLGLFDSDNMEETRAATLKFHLMLQSKYNALVSGDGACAGCGEKSVLRAIATLTEAVMRPIFHKKADRLYQKADTLGESGLQLLEDLKNRDEAAYSAFRKTVLHILMGYGREDSAQTEAHIRENFSGTDRDLIDAMSVVMRQDADNHSKTQMLEGMTPNGMAAMAMAAHTGCNTVYGSTPPNNPHPYPWMNSLFQDGATIGWLIGESFIQDQSNFSVIPERLADAVLNAFPEGFSEDDWFRYTHFTDAAMTDQEILELPKVWVIGGDGAMGDIGYQNVSKVILQNRPNVKMLMLDTQVYSNTGGQNSDSSPMTGGFDMNQAGAATEGKRNEMKCVAESFLGGHGSPYVAQVSMANTSALYKSLIDGIYYRGTAFYQVYTTCQPEHGVPDWASQQQALLVRDSRGMPEFIFNPTLGETYAETFSIKGNPQFNKDWYVRSAPVTRTKYQYTPAHWAFTEARFRLHHKMVKEDQIKDKILLEDLVQLITQNDIVHTRYLDPNHRAYIPTFGIYTLDHKADGSTAYHILSRQMVLFCIERRKAWRIMQSRAGIENKDYLTQKELIAQIESGDLTREAFLNRRKVESLAEQAKLAEKA